MVIITDANGNIQAPTIPENVYQGSNLANEIVFLAPLPQSNQCSITFRLPNGTVTEQQFMTPYTDVPSQYDLSAWVFKINKDITALYGQVSFQIRVYSAVNIDDINNTTTIVSSCQGTFPVLRGVAPLPSSTPSSSTFNDILIYLSTMSSDIENGWLESKAILPYDENFEYSIGATLFDKATDTLYTSLQDENIGNPLSDTDWWGKTKIYNGGSQDIQDMIDTSIAQHNVSPTAHADLFNAKQNALTPTQLDAVNSGIDSTKVSQIATNTNAITTINSKIPAQASAENQLADKDFVNSSIATNTANFIGTFTSVELLESVGYLVIYSILKEDSVIAKGSVVNGTTYTHDTTLHNDLNITADSTLAFGSVIKSGSTIEIGSIINHETYESQTTTSDDITIDTITNNDYANVINQELDFIDTTHMNNYDKTLLTNFDYAWIPNGAKYDLYRFDIETQTWGLRATAINKGDVTLVTAYNRYTFNGDTQEWMWNYTVNTSGFTASQWAAINSGATAELITKIGTNALNTTAQNLSDAINELEARQVTFNAGTNVTINGTTISADGSKSTTKQTFEIPFNSSNKLVIEVEDTGRTILRHYENNNSYMVVLPQWAGVLACVNQIFPTYSNSATYSVGDLVNYNNYFYRCNTAITTPHDWDANEWTITTLVEVLKDFVTLDTVQTITGKKTIDAEMTFTNSGAAGTNNLSIKNDNGYNAKIKMGSTENMRLMTGGTFFGATAGVTTDNSFDLGASSTAWKDFYLKGKIDFGDNAIILKDGSSRVTIKYNNVDKVKVGSLDTLFSNRVTPDSNNTYDLGRSGVHWKDLYLAGNITDGTNTVAVANIENKTNKVTSISNTSTDDQYPSAKCVYDLVGNLDAILQDLNNGGGV